MDAERAIEILEMMKPFSPGANRENRERDEALTMAIDAIRVYSVCKRKCSDAIDMVLKMTYKIARLEYELRQLKGE